MNEPTITCPNCRTEIRLNESLAAPLVEATRRHYEQRLNQKDAEIAQREAAVRQARETIEEQVASRIKVQREEIAADEARKAKLFTAADLEQKTRQLSELQDVLKERDVKLAQAQQAQAELLRKQRELDDARREMDLTVEKRVQESLSDVRSKAKQEAEEGLRLRVLEKEEQIASMQRQIEDLRKKAEQGSQQLQGEVQEIELESLLRAKFPHDLIEPVPKGEFGGDVLQRIRGPNGQDCGSILWESKRTKNWSDGWLTKLREDQRAAKAELCLLVTHALPKGIEAFDLVDGVWVSDVKCAIRVALSLRQSLITLSAARHATEGQQTKMELVYQYLTGPRFRHRVEAIVEKFSDMQGDLDRERKTMTRLWAKREAQIRGVIESTLGMYGDLQGIAGKSLQEIDGLDPKLLDGTFDPPQGVLPIISDEKI
jgi:hypothetical protein